MIRFDAVSKLYKGAPRPALEQISLEIGAGEFVFLVGASGSGKSSLLRLVLREEQPSKGEIHVLGQRLTTISSRKVPYFRRSLGVVFQDFRLLPGKTVAQNVAFTLQVLGKSRGFIQQAVPDVLDTVGLAHKAQNLPNELSGGEQQRVAIARAVVNKPAILLADEPTGNLDPTTSEGIMQVLQRINDAGTTVVMATHDVTIVDRMQKRVVELVDGHIIRDELEASYVTTSVPVQPAAPPGPRRASVWAFEDTGPIGLGPLHTQPIGVARSTRRTPVVPPVPVPTAAPVRPTVARAEPAASTGPVPAASVPVRTGVIRVVEPGAAAVPVWARGTGPVPQQVAPDGVERRGWIPEAPEPAVPVEPAVPWQRPAEATDEQAEQARRGVRTITGPIETQAADDEPDALRTGRHRIPLPDHLDFVGGLGLRTDRADDDEIGPSS